MALDFQEMFRRELEREMKEAASNNTTSSQKSSFAKGAPIDLESFRLADASKSVYYVPDYLSQSEQDFLVERITAQEDEAQWARLSKRRMRNLGGIPHPDGMIAEAFPGWMSQLSAKLQQSAVFHSPSPNQVLLNRYLPGEGISPHCDGPLYEPYVAIISLGSGSLMDFQPAAGSSASSDSGGASCSVYLQPGSLLIFSDDAYRHMKHSIQPLANDVITDDTVNRSICGLDVGQTIPRESERFSLTIREVRKVSIRADDVLTSHELHEKERRKTWWLNSINEGNSNR